MKKLIDTIRGERYDFDNLCKDYRRVLDNSREEGERKRLLEKAADLLDETTVAWNDRVIQKHLFREAWGRAIMATRAAKKGEGGVVGDLSDWLVLNTSDRFDFLNIAYKWLLDNEGAAWAREVEKEFLAPIDVRWVASRLGEFAAYGGDPRGLWRVLWDSYTTGGPSLKRDVWERVGKGKANESWLKVAPHDIMVGLPPFSGMVGPAVWSFYEAYKSVIYAPESLGSGFAYLLRDYFRGLTSEYVSAWVRSWGYDKASLMFVLLLQKEIPQDLASTDSNELEKGFRGLLSRVLANHCYAMRTLSIMRQRLGGIDVSTLRETMPPENLAEVICDVLSAPLERDLKGEGVRDEDMRRRAINTIIRDIRYTPDLNITAHGFNMLEQIFKTAGADNATHLPTFISVKG